MDEAELLDVIIVGAGPAGLNAALLLARCRRRIAVFDDGEPRNRRSHALHGFLSRDGTHPMELLRLGREEIRRYGVPVQDLRVLAVEHDETFFTVHTDDGRTHHARKLLLATGVKDEVPAIPGMDELYGTSVHHCPYCDGWEVRDAPLAAYGRGGHGVGLALELLGWSRDVVLCTDGVDHLEDHHRERLAIHGIPIRTERILRLDGTGGRLERIVFASGEPLQRRAMFFATMIRQHSGMAAALGVRFNRRGTAATGQYEQTPVRGLFVAGDASRDVQFVIVAAAEGAKAAYAINCELASEALHRVEAEARKSPRVAGAR